MPHQTVTVQLHPGSAMDRTVPALIQSIVTSEEWIGFCGKIDGVVQPHRTRSIMSAVGTIGGFLLGGIITTFSVISMSSARFDCFPNCRDGQGTNPGVIIGPIVTIGSVFVGHYFLTTNSSRCENEIKKACEDFSRNYPLLSVHYKTERRRRHTDYFFEILVADQPPRGNHVHPVTNETQLPVASVMAVEVPSGSADGEGAWKATTSAPTFSTNQPGATATAPKSSSPAERMNQLEQMRGMLTEEEYRAKRTEILDSV